MLRGLFGALVLEGLRPTNPAAEIRIKSVASGKHHPAVPQSAAITTLDRLPESDKPRDIRDRALCLLALAVGARRFELAALDVRSIERDDRHSAAVEFTGKGGKSVRMTIKRGVLKAIDRWLAVAELTDKPDSPLFTSLSHHPEDAGKRLTGDGIRFIIKRIFSRHSPHGLRARAVTDIWSQSGANLEHAQAFACHSSPAVTEKVYIQAEKLEQAMKYTYDYA